MGWEALELWDRRATQIVPLSGGVANEVWSVRIGGRVAIGRLGSRSDADLAWETDLMRYLERQGLVVPVPIPTADGRLFAEGLVVMTYLTESRRRRRPTGAEWPTSCADCTG